MKLNLIEPKNVNFSIYFTYYIGKLIKSKPFYGICKECRATTWACPGFLKEGGPISLGSLKKGHQILKGGGIQWSDRGGGCSTLVSLGQQILLI